jgi:UDP:flavonoid glycosyltransferase YjiC (YdhE family)
VGPLLWEPPAATSRCRRARPLVLVAPSTSQDPSHRLLRATLRGLADAPVRVLAVWNRSRWPSRRRARERAAGRLAVLRARDAACDVVVCHGGHGTLARALASGCAVVIVPAAGDMNESAARIDWSGVGARVPRALCAPGPVRLAVERVLAAPAMRERAGELATWWRTHDPPARASELIEELAAQPPRSVR